MTVTLKASSSILDRNERRVDGREKVTGEARFAADFEREGMLWAAFLGSSVPHARIVAIETAAARRIAGVHAVLTGKDIGEHCFGRRLFDRPALAVDRVRFVGDLVVAVAAETQEAADEAIAAIDVIYDELPAVFEPDEALAPGAPILHEGDERYHYLGGSRPDRPHPNVQGRRVITKGDLEAGFAAADRIFEHTFETPRVHAGYLEPRAALVWIDDDGNVHIISTNKAPFALREQFSIATGVSVEKIDVEPAYIGGDFGGKGLSIEEFPCYYLARATKRSIKCVRSYLDDIRESTARHASRTTLRTGVTKDGRFTAVDVRMVFNGGAYAAGKPVPTLLPGTDPKMPYNVPCGRLERTAVYTNTIPGGHARAPGDVQFMFALESHVDMIAREMGIDPLEFRARNAVKGDESDLEGVPYREPAALDVLATLRREARWDEPLAQGRGRGISLGVRHISGGKARLRLRLLRNGGVEVETGAAEQGMGVLTVIQRVVAATLEIQPERVRVVRRGTLRAPLDPGAGGSRQTNVTGGAAHDGAAQLRRLLEGVGYPSVPWQAAVEALLRDGAAEVTGAFEAAHSHEPEWHDFCGFVADVSVDTETGAITVNEVVCVADVGTIVSPVAHRGQISGGFVFGFGHALTEELRVTEGRIENLTLADYKLPTQTDVPPFRLTMLQQTGGPGPFGAKMAGEINTAAVAPALANAIAAACGARITSLPLTAEKVFAAL